MNQTQAKFIVCRFEIGPRGMFCRQPVDYLGPVYLEYPDRGTKLNVSCFENYLCEVMNMRMVRVVKNTKDILRELNSALCAAEWKRGDLITSGIVTEIATADYSTVTASWYESNGRYKHKTVTLKFKMGASSLSMSFSHTDAGVEMDELVRRIHVCTGPAVSIAAVISRQRESRTNRW